MAGRGRPKGSSKKNAAAVEREAGKVDAGDLQRVVAEIIRQKELAAEYNGNAGAQAKNAIERYSLNKDALSVTTKLAKQTDLNKRAATIRSCLEYWHKMGFFDQTDLFDDLVETMREVVAEIEARPAGSGKPSLGEGAADGFLQ